MLLQFVVWKGGRLERLISLSFLQGYVPLYVNATAGTTVYGAFDPIQEIADICEKYNLWLHVDVSAVTQSGLGPSRGGSSSAL